MMANAAPRTVGCTGSEDHVVTRYDAEKSARIAQLEGELANKNAEIYTDKKSLELYQYIDNRLRGVEGKLAQQAVYNATNNGIIGCTQYNSAKVAKPPENSARPMITR